MLFRLVLLATLAWHTAFCVAKTDKGKPSRTEVIVKGGRRVLATFSKDKKATTLSIKRQSSASGDTKCSDMIVRQHGPNPPLPDSQHCKLEARCYLDGRPEWPLCLLHFQGGRKLKQCGVFSHQQLEYIPECDTQLRPVKDFVIAIKSKHAPTVLKQMTLSVPKHLESTKIAEISKEVKPNGPSTLLPTTKMLPTSRLVLNVATTCILQVKCYDPDTKRWVWTTCLADFPNKAEDLFGSLGQCDQVSPDVPVRQCDLSDGFMDMSLPCPADGEDSSANHEQFRVELILSGDQRRWATYTDRDGHGMLSQVQREKPDLPSARRDAIEVEGAADSLPESSDCKLTVITDDGQNRLLCTVRNDGENDMIQHCGASNEKRLERLPECDTSLKPPRDTTIAIQSNKKLGSFKQITLSLPRQIDSTKPFPISKTVENDLTIVPCQQLPTKDLRLDAERCVLWVLCEDTDTGQHFWGTCLADFPRGPDLSGSLGQCGQDLFQDTKPCDLDDSFKKLALPPSDESDMYQC